MEIEICTLKLQYCEFTKLRRLYSTIEVFTGGLKIVQLQPIHGHCKEVKPLNRWLMSLMSVNITSPAFQCIALTWSLMLQNIHNIQIYKGVNKMPNTEWLLGLRENCSCKYIQSCWLSQHAQQRVVMLYSGLLLTAVQNKVECACGLSSVCPTETRS